MTQSEKRSIRKWAKSLSDEDLESQYYRSVLDSLGSEAEEMYERGYDLRDIYEQEKLERDRIVKSHILEEICVERGIPLWEEAENCGT